MATQPTVRRRRSARQLRTKTKRWFIEPLNTSTNAMISRVIDEENLHREIDTSRGRRPALWECSEEICENFRSSAGEGVWFHIYFQIGGWPITWIYTYGAKV